MNEEIRRGEEARQLLAHPMLVEAFEGLEAALLEKIKQCDASDLKMQQTWVISFQLLGRVKSHIEEIVQTGELASMKEPPEPSTWQKLTQLRGRR